MNPRLNSDLSANIFDKFQFLKNDENQLKPLKVA